MTTLLAKTVQKGKPTYEYTTYCNENCSNTILTLNDVMNDNMAASAHFGTHLGTFFY